MRFRIRLIVSTLLVGAPMVPGRLGAQADTISPNLYRESYALETRREYGSALTKMREIVRLSGRTYFVTMRMAWLGYLAGDFTASQADYTAAIAIDPKAIEPKLGLTLPLLAARDWKTLERACRDVLVLDPRNATALARLAQAAYWSGNYPEAASVYRQLATDYPSELDYKTGQAWALLKSGRAAEARQLFESVLAVSPDNASAKQGLTAK